MNEVEPIRLAQVSAGYGKRMVLDGFDLGLQQGTITAIVGPNGSGKSTVIRAMARLLPARSGASDLARSPASYPSFPNLHRAHRG